MISHYQEEEMQGINRIEMVKEYVRNRKADEEAVKRWKRQQNRKP